MPRPKKIGLDYFPLDTTWDEKLKALLSIFGNDGLSWIVTFWQAAYRDEYGRVNINKYFGEVLAKDSRNTTEKQTEIVKMAVDINLIKEIEPGVYTSNGIQKRIKEVSSERGAALKRYYANKESTKERIKIKREIKDKLKQSKVKDFGNTSPAILSWVNSFEIYQLEELKKYNELIKDEKWLQTQENIKPYANLNVLKSIERAHLNFWSKESGWKHKKKSRTVEIDWPATYANAIGMKSNQVFDNQNRNQSTQMEFQKKAEDKYANLPKASN